MPIVNTNIAETTNITQNGTYDVARYTTAVVNTPTAPQYYLEKVIDSNGFLQNSSHALTIQNPVKLGDSVLRYAYFKNNSIEAVDLSGVTSVNKFSLNYAFSESSITSLDLSGLVSNDQMESEAFANMCNDCRSLKTVDMSSAKYILGDKTLQNVFYGCTSLEHLYLQNLMRGGNATNSRSFSNMCSGCSSLQEFDLRSFLWGQGNSLFSSACYNCTSLTSVNMKDLCWCVSNNQLSGTFSGCSALPTVNFESLYKIDDSSIFGSTFKNCTSLTSLYFYALDTDSFGTSTNQFNNMLNGVTGCTVHFPKKIQNTIGSWTDVVNGFGGTNTTVLFDLVGTITVNGINYVSCHIADKGNYSCWVKEGATLQGKAFTRCADCNRFTGQKIFMFGTWGSYYYTDKLDLAIGDKFYWNLSQEQPISTISNVDCGVVYTLSNQPSVNDAVYSDEGITQVGTVSSIA